MRLTTALPAALLLLTAACREPQPSTPDKSRGNLTLGAVQNSIVNGQTTKAQVMEWFGSPNLVTRTKEGEVWNYTRQGTASELKSSSVGVWFLIGATGRQSGIAQTGSYSFDLLLRFNNEDVVTDHKVLQTAF
jgi:outer membrane protein assembly factor BamE (lipoprotein component of BamABCDE complex)